MPTAKVFKTSTCKKHNTACNEKTEGKTKLISKTKGCKKYMPLHHLGSEFYTTTQTEGNLGRRVGETD